MQVYMNPSNYYVVVDNVRVRTIFRFGGADETRTRHPLLAKQVLCQMSYSPSAIYFILLRLFLQDISDLSLFNPEDISS